MTDGLELGIFAIDVIIKNLEVFRDKKMSYEEAIDVMKQQRVMFENLIEENEKEK